jgi:hypothetical protein
MIRKGQSQIFWSWTKEYPRQKKKGKVLRRRKPVEHRSLAMSLIWGKGRGKDERSILTGAESAYMGGKGVEGDSGKQAVGRRRRYEGEEAWENRGMAQVPFYNSGNVWHANRRSQESL